MLKAIYRPIEKWPGEPTPPQQRRPSPFKAEFYKTENLLQFELEKIPAQNVVIQVEAEPSQIRTDGHLKGGTQPKGPAVLVTFTGAVDGHTYTYPCDTFTDWDDNLRAIALALEALRKVDRYGVTRRGEQYQGFRALPTAESSTPKLTAEEAAELLGKITGVPAATLSSDEELFGVMSKLASKRVHPDGDGGSHEEFVRVQQANAVLIEHFKARKAKAAGR